MILINNSILLLWICVPGLIYADSGEDLNYDFYQDDSSYSFRGSFVIEAELACLKSVVFDFEHVAKYAYKAKKIKSVRKGDNWNEISYTYRRYVFFESQTNWHRIFYPERNRLIFELVSSENNLRIMPDIISSSGYYQISPSENAYRMEYFQECHLNTDHIMDSYLRTVRKEAIEFLYEFREYIEKTCLKGNH